MNTLNETWRCGDCGRDYPMSKLSCGRYLDDYLSFRGGTVESAIARSVEKGQKRLERGRNFRFPLAA